MIITDSVRIATTWNAMELVKFCRKIDVPTSVIVQDTVPIINMNQHNWIRYRAEKIGKMKRVTPVEFDRLAWRDEYGALFNAIQAQQAKKFEKTVKSLDKHQQRLERLKNGRKYVLTYSVRNPTGEKNLFRKLIRDRGAKSEISGDPLITDENHPKWVNQFLHCLPKSRYKRFRLREDNIFLGTWQEHDLQTRQPGKCRKDPRWKKFFDRHEQLKQEYYQK